MKKGNFTFLRNNVGRNALLATLLFFTSIKVNAQNPSLEFAAGDGNPTGNGPVTTTTIQFRKNTDNPTGNTFATYTAPSALTTTFSLSNKQYDYTPLSASYGGTVFFGYDAGGTNGSSTSLFPLMNFKGHLLTLILPLRVLLLVLEFR